MSTSPHARLGRIGEQMAARHLAQQGLRIVARNWRYASQDVRGELDLVAWEGPTLVFCEVKTRRREGAGPPLAAVTPRKQVQLRQLAAAYLASTRTAAPQVRFDVVGVSWPDRGGRPSLVHLRGAC